MLSRACKITSRLFQVLSIPVQYLRQRGCAGRVNGGHLCLHLLVQRGYVVSGVCFRRRELGC